MLFNRPDTPKVLLYSGGIYTLCNTFPGPTRLSIQNYILIGSAVSAQLTAVTPPILYNVR